MESSKKSNDLIDQIRAKIAVLEKIIEQEEHKEAAIISSAIPKKEVKAPHPALSEKLAEFRALRNFSAGEFVERRCQEFLLYLKECNIHSVVLSISGGVDSACVLGLLKHARDIASTIPDHPFNPENGGKIIAVAQPIFSTPSIQNRAYELAKSFDIHAITVDQSVEHLLLVDTIENAIGGELNGFAKSMFKSYERTPTAYLLASHFRGVVVGTGNLDEDGYLYYYCKFGDGAVDVGLIWDVHKSEVFTLARHLGVPESILIAPPSADLAPGQTDETESGVTYDMVELIYNTIFKFTAEERAAWLASLPAPAKEQFDHEADLVEAIHRKGVHKADLNPKNIGSDWYRSWAAPKVAEHSR